MSRTTPRRRLFGAVAATVMVFGAITAAAPAVSANAAAPATPATPAINTHPSYNGLSLTPPMGFNDWAGFECDSAMNETLFTKTADEIVSS